MIVRGYAKSTGGEGGVYLKTRGREPRQFLPFKLMPAELIRSGVLSLFFVCDFFLPSGEGGRVGGGILKWWIAESDCPFFVEHAQWETLMGRRKVPIYFG